MVLNTAKLRFLTYTLCLFFHHSKAVVITGGQAAVNQNIINLIKKQSPDCSSDMHQKSWLAPSLHEQMIDAIRPYGYFKPTIVVNNEDTANSCHDWELNIELNEAVRWHNLDVSLKGEGTALFDLRSFLFEHGVTKGEVFSSLAYEQLKSSLIKKVRENGFLSAEWQETKVQIDGQQADLILILRTGVKYHIGKISYVQNPKFIGENLVKKLVKLETGQEYRRAVIEKQREQLQRTGYFSTVIWSQQVNDIGVVDLLFELAPADRIAYSVGAGIDTDKGPLIDLEYINQRVNQRGMQFQFQQQWSLDSQHIQTKASYPLLGRKSVIWQQWAFDWINDSYDNRLEDTIKISSHWLMRRSESDAWKASLSYGDYQFGFAGELKRSVQLFTPMLSWSRVIANDSIRPTSGYKTRVSAEMAHQSLLSDVDFFQVSASHKHIIPMGDSVRWLWRISAQSTVVDDINELPFSYRSFTGGDYTVRGFNFQSLAPKNSAGYINGGQHELTLSTEWEFLWRPNWAYAVFVDSGNAFDDVFDSHTATGIGLRWFTPIGAVRFDVAHAIDSSLDRGFQFHFTVGSDL